MPWGWDRWFQGFAKGFLKSHGLKSLQVWDRRTQGPSSETAVFAELFQEKSRGPGQLGNRWYVPAQSLLSYWLTQEVPIEALWMLGPDSFAGGEGSQVDL